MRFYQIEFRIFASIRQRSVNMNRIKETLEVKGISQTGELLLPNKHQTL